VQREVEKKIHELLEELVGFGTFTLTLTAPRRPLTQASRTIAGQLLYCTAPRVCPSTSSRGARPTRPARFTPHVLKPILLHTTRPASFTPHVSQADFASHHSSCELHTTRPGSRFCFTPHVSQADFASHHTSCERHTTHSRAYMLHTTHPASFTPRVLQTYRLDTTRPPSFTPHFLQAFFYTTQATRAAPVTIRECYQETMNSDTRQSDPEFAPVLLLATQSAPGLSSHNHPASIDPILKHSSFGSRVACFTTPGLIPRKNDLAQLIQQCNERRVIFCDVVGCCFQENCFLRHNTKIYTSQVLCVDVAREG